jgi:dTDP-4-dehydrorhamnose 3,5-epimerase
VSVQLLAPRRREDERGWFVETYHGQIHHGLGITCRFVQDNHSMSRVPGTLRGLHFQAPPHAQAKLVRCVRGAIFDVAVDLRAGSPTFGHWVGAQLSAENGRQIFVPVGFAHGFLTLEPESEVIYKVSDFYAPACEAGIAWDDPDIGISWPLGRAATPLLSEKDRALPRLKDLTLSIPYDGRPLMPLDI